jgi:hypothetical protein
MLKRIPLLLGVLVAGIGSLTHAQEAGAAKALMSGQWEVNWETPRGPMTMTMELKQDGEALTGKVETRGGWQDIKDGKVSGSDMSFVLEMVRGDQTFALAYKGTLQDDGTLQGTITTPRGERPWTAKRVES